MKDINNIYFSLFFRVARVRQCPTPRYAPDSYHNKRSYLFTNLQFERWCRQDLQRRCDCCKTYGVDSSYYGNHNTISSLHLQKKYIFILLYVILHVKLLSKLYVILLLEFIKITPIVKNRDNLVNLPILNTFSYYL